MSTRQGTDPCALTGRVVLVTGAGQGVGRAIARRCAELGATVVVNDFYRDRAERVAAELTDQGHQASAVGGDVTDFDAVQAMVTGIVDEVGGVDVLVNNAGNAGASGGSLFSSPPFWETGPQDWDRWLGANLFGVLNVTRAVLPHMVTQGWGRVVSIVSDAGRVGEASLVVYSGAKAGAAGFSRGLARAVGRHGVTVNCIALGAMNTDSVSEVTGDPAALKRALGGYPIRRLGEPGDAANMVGFLASDAASWITGQTYPVNGGYSFAV
jgi:NAD(P)-dependent dehydrogenase (short-subunit alcohol dehydrogenase family)